MGHELASLPIRLGLPDACKKEDALPLRSIVEAQAIELVKLRRALLAANSIAAERLKIIYSMHGEDAEHEINLKDTLEKISDLENDIHSIIKKSRWRKVGIKLGFEKRREWESRPWQSNLTLNSENPERGCSSADYKPPLSFALNEQNRLTQLWLEVSQSKWRQLGIKIRLAQKLPLDLAHHGSFKDYAQLDLPQPQAKKTQSWELVARQPGHGAFLQYAGSRFLEECKASAVDAILDIGAKSGQFGRGIRESGYQGQIFSFESLYEAHSELILNARDDMLWHVIERCAVSAANRTTPSSVVRDHEACPIITLESFIETTFSDQSMTFGLRIDAQCDANKVIEGLHSCDEQVKVILCSMSLQPLNAERPSMAKVCQQLSRLGLRCVALGPKYEHPVTDELVQVDGVFTRI